MTAAAAPLDGPSGRTYDDLPDRGVLRRFRDHLPLTPNTPMI